VNDVGNLERPTNDFGISNDFRDKGEIGVLFVVFRDETIRFKFSPRIDFCVESIEQFFSAA
jgi:hypothetical protein